MKTTMLLVTIFLFTSGCIQYVQVFDTKSTNAKIENELYVFENDSLKITYSFWAEKGLMNFSIFNKLQKPLYIDWKKSSYIDNSVKLNYWIDEQKETSRAYFGIYYYNGPRLEPVHAISDTYSASVSSTLKIERITFIPPASHYYRSPFYILPYSFSKLDDKSEINEVTRNDMPNLQTKIIKKSFTKETSPIVFRNFLTFSMSESFENEFYIDNEFYVSSITEMDSRHFKYRKLDAKRNRGRFYEIDEKGNYIVLIDTKKKSSFYIYNPKNR